jgi:hypothetical protein
MILKSHIQNVHTRTSTYDDTWGNKGRDKRLILKKKIHVNGSKLLVYMNILWGKFKIIYSMHFEINTFVQ